MNPNYLKKTENLRLKDYLWNIPDRKQGTLVLIGGNSQNFRAIEQNYLFASQKLPFQNIKIILPDSLKIKLPSLQNISFMPSTNSGSFAKSRDFENLCHATKTEPTILLGDFSKNAETASAIIDFIRKTSSPIYLARDTLDIVISDSTDFLEQENIHIIASMAQLQKLFRAVYYPKMLLLSAPLLQICETIHKFTLSYPIAITTFHDSKIITAKNGSIFTTPINETDYTPISLWQGQLACNIATLAFFNPQKSLESSAMASYMKKDR